LPYRRIGEIIKNKSKQAAPLKTVSGGIKLCGRKVRTDKKGGMNEWHDL